MNPMETNTTETAGTGTGANLVQTTVTLWTTINLAGRTQQQAIETGRKRKMEDAEQEEHREGEHIELESRMVVDEQPDGDTPGDALSALRHKPCFAVSLTSFSWSPDEATKASAPNSLAISQPILQIGKLPQWRTFKFAYGRLISLEPLYSTSDDSETLD
eukprot:gene5523-11130_t